jgi:L-amino acid N-acyltransferase YncA
MNMNNLNILEWDHQTDLNHSDLNHSDLNHSAWPHLDAAQLERDGPHLHLQALEGDQVQARASIWLDGPRLQPLERTGLIGHYAATSRAAGKALLAAACDRLRQAGCARVIGPMDGNTWKGYRLVSDEVSDEVSNLAQPSEKPFFLEPHNPLEWNTHFLESGFEVLARYHSSLSLEPAPDPRIPQLRERFAAQGIHTRVALPQDLERELGPVFEVALESFSQNFLYTPLSKADFLELYPPMLARLPLGFVRIAEHAGRAVGFAFAFPDLMRDEPDTLILKTVGIRRQRIYAGLGALLADEMHDLARFAQMPRVIHALIHDSNVSGKTSAKTGQMMRRYALYARAL